MFLMISQSRTAYASAGSKLATVSVVPMMIVFLAGSVVGASVGAVVGAAVGAEVGGAA